MNKYLKFNSRSKNGKCLSNFSLLPIKLNNIYYISGEHCFQSNKYIEASKKTNNPQRQVLLLNYSEKFQGINTIFKTSKDAKKAGGKKGLLLSEVELNYWNKNIAEEIQYKICNYKKNNYKIIQSCLLKFKDYIIIHQDNFANNNTIWGGKIKNNNIIGYNKLGTIWMNI